MERNNQKQQINQNSKNTNNKKVKPIPHFEKYTEINTGNGEICRMEASKDERYAVATHYNGKVTV